MKRYVIKFYNIVSNINILTILFDHTQWPDYGKTRISRDETLFYSFYPTAARPALARLTQNLKYSIKRWAPQQVVWRRRRRRRQQPPRDINAPAAEPFARDTRSFRSWKFFPRRPW